MPEKGSQLNMRDMSGQNISRGNSRGKDLSSRYPFSCSAVLSACPPKQESPGDLRRRGIVSTRMDSRLWLGRLFGLRLHWRQFAKQRRAGSANLGLFLGSSTGNLGLDLIAGQ